MILISFLKLILSSLRYTVCFLIIIIELNNVNIKIFSLFLKYCMYVNFVIIKVRMVVKIMNLYNQIPHLTQDTTWESDKTIKHHKPERQEVSLFPVGDHKATMTRQENITNTNINNKNDPQKKLKHCLGMVSKNILLEGLNLFHCANLARTFNLLLRMNEIMPRSLFKLILIYENIVCYYKSACLNK